MWVLVQRTGEGDAGRLGGKLQVRDRTGTPTTDSSTGSAMQEREGERHGAAESHSQARRAMQRSAVQCGKLRGWIRGSQRQERAERCEWKWSIGTSAVGLGNRNRAVDRPHFLVGVHQALRPCRFPAGRLLHSTSITGAAPPCAQDSPGCCRRDMPYEGPKSTF
jgi:hypothetical protein